jgi:hypothetical protein
MPKVKVGSEFQKIPFDADAIAELMRQGHVVFPDDDTNKEQYLAQDTLVRNAIGIRVARDLWGDKKSQPELRRFNLNGVPSLREDDSFGKRIQPPGAMNGGNFLNIKPNPFMTNMPEIDMNDLISPEKKKKSWDL